MCSKFFMAVLLQQHRGPDGYLLRDILPPYRPIRLKIEFRTAPVSGSRLTPMYSTAEDTIEGEP